MRHTQYFAICASALFGAAGICLIPPAWGQVPTVSNTWCQDDGAALTSCAAEHYIKWSKGPSGVDDWGLYRALPGGGLSSASKSSRYVQNLACHEVTSDGLER